MRNETKHTHSGKGMETDVRTHVSKFKDRDPQFADRATKVATKATAYRKVAKGIVDTCAEIIKQLIFLFYYSADDESRETAQ